LEELAATDADSGKVYAAYKAFRNGISNWTAHSEKPYANIF